MKTPETPIVETQDILTFITLHLEYIQRHFRVVKIGVFGSFARHEQNDNSDIDIVIELRDNTQNIYELKQELREFIGKRFHRKVDIAREKYLKTSFKKRILTETIYVGEGHPES